MPLTAATERLTAATRRSVLPYSIFSSYSISLLLGFLLTLEIRKKPIIQYVTGVLTSTQEAWASSIEALSLSCPNSTAPAIAFQISGY